MMMWFVGYTPMHYPDTSNQLYTPSQPRLLFYQLICIAKGKESRTVGAKKAKVIPKMRINISRELLQDKNST